MLLVPSLTHANAGMGVCAIVCLTRVRCAYTWRRGTATEGNWCWSLWAGISWKLQTGWWLEWTCKLYLTAISRCKWNIWSYRLIVDWRGPVTGRSAEQSGWRSPDVNLNHDANKIGQICGWSSCPDAILFLHCTVCSPRVTTRNSKFRKLAKDKSKSKPEGGSLIEFRFCEDTRPDPQLQKAKAQHSMLIANLNRQGYREVKLRVILVGAMGTFYNT